MFHRLSLFILAITMVTIASAEEIRIAVSDLIADYIAEPIQALSETNALEISVISIGSLPALDYLRSDEIDLAIVATPEGTALSDDAFQTYPFAYDAAIVAVNKANPINEVSLSDLQSIFGSDADLTIEFWRDLDSSSLGDLSIKPFVGEDETGISLELFKYSALKGEPMKRTINKFKDAEIEELLSDNIASIAVIPHLPDNDAIKALMIATDSDSPAFGPTDDNVYYGDYPIRLPFQIVYDRARKAELKEVLRILMSDEIAEALRTNHLFVPPDSVRDSSVMSLDLVE